YFDLAQKLSPFGLFFCGDFLTFNTSVPEQKKGNRESKKPKAKSDGTKKQKKDPKRHDKLT
ncbi:hypothetical protein B7486_48555, partial [cyanobacterium TDX16]